MTMTNVLAYRPLLQSMRVLSACQCGAVALQTCNAMAACIHGLLSRTDGAGRCYLVAEGGKHALQVSFVLASQFLLKYLSLTAARWLHNSMLKPLLRSDCLSTPAEGNTSYLCSAVWHAPLLASACALLFL